MNATRRIGLVAFDRVQALDIVGPLDAFAAANELADGSRAAYELLVLAPHKGIVKTESGLRLVADAVLEDAPALDTVVIPGGPGVRLSAATRAHLAAWLQRRARRIRARP